MNWVRGSGRRHQTTNSPIDQPNSPIHQPTNPPISLALKLLSRRELTTAELRQRLLDREIPGDAVEAAIERLTRDGALDDRRAARAITRTHALVKGRGRRRIERELTTRGISRDLAREVLDEVFSEVSEEEALERALRRRLRSGRIMDRAHFSRVYQYLIRLGFDGDKAIAALRKHAAKDSDAEP